MSKMKMIMLVNTANENLCEFLPSDSPQKLTGEMHNIAINLKRVPSQGCVQTTTNKFFYRQFQLNSEKDSNIKQKEEDKLVLFVCTDLKYKDIYIYKFLDEVFNSLSENSYTNFKINPESKKNIAKIFYKYQDPNNINKEELNLENNNLEFGALNDFTSLDIDTKKGGNSTSLKGIVDSIDKNSLNKMNKGRIPIEVTKMKKWKTLKCIFLFINIIMIILTVILFYYLLGKSENN